MNLCYVPDEDVDKSLKLPCILHMDSIKGNHSGLKNLIQRYLYDSEFRIAFSFICVC